VKYARRTDDARIAELAAKIEGIRERAVRRAARADPVHQQTRIALRALEKALRDGPEPSPLVTAITVAREAISEALGGHAPVAATPTTTRRPRARKAKEPANE
jgi:hypothetical protein